MKKISVEKQRQITGGFGYYARCDCPGLSAGECTKQYSDCNGSKGKFKRKYYFWFMADAAWYSAYLSACACLSEDVGI